MEQNWYYDELRRKLRAVHEDKGSSFSKIDELTAYIAARLTSDSATYHAMRVREAGGCTRDVLKAALEGAFGRILFTSGHDRLNSEINTLSAVPADTASPAATIPTAIVGICSQCGKVDHFTPDSPPTLTQGSSPTPP